MQLWVFSVSALMCIYGAFYIVLARFYSIRSCLTLVKAITQSIFTCFAHFTYYPLICLRERYDTCISFLHVGDLAKDWLPFRARAEFNQQGKNSSIFVPLLSNWPWFKHWLISRLSSIEATCTGRVILKVHASELATGKSTSLLGMLEEIWDADVDLPVVTRILWKGHSHP